MNERELLIDCLRRLNRAGVTYYLTGSMASNYWGIPRTTHTTELAPESAAVLRPFRLPRVPVISSDERALSMAVGRGIG
jgi:hypothetical protein